MIDRGATRHIWPTHVTVRAVVTVLTLAAVGAACTGRSGETANAKTLPGATSPGTPGTDTLAARDGIGAGKITIPGAETEDGQWLRPAKDYASTRFSGLDLITTANASQ